MTGRLKREDGCRYKPAAQIVMTRLWIKIPFYQNEIQRSIVQDARRLRLGVESVSGGGLTCNGKGTRALPTVGIP
jgi:hypothetical protein